MLRKFKEAVKRVESVHTINSTNPANGRLSSHLVITDTNKKAQLTPRSARDSVGIVAPPGEWEYNYNSQHRLIAKLGEKSNVQQFKVMQDQ